MNREELLMQLDELLNGFIVTEQCHTEIEEFLIVHAGSRKEFLKLLSMRLRQLNGLPMSQITNLREFEKLKKEDGMFSMHLSSKGFNYRILFRYLENNQILLLGFEEKQGKKRTKYSNFLKSARDRFLNYTKGDDHNE